MRNNIILITGASSGIGKDAALQLIKAGHTVYGASRRLEKMQEIVDAGGHSIQFDVKDDAQLKAATNKIIHEQGRIDILVNNAGYGSYGSVEETTIEDARYQFDVNFIGLTRLAQLVIPHMRKQQSGIILNISSMGGKIYTPLGAWYHATKHALEGWSDCLRLEMKPFGVDVVIIEPGAIHAEFGDVMVQPMMERSGSGLYKNQANAIAKTTTETYGNGCAAPVSVISNVIVKAIHAKTPKTRYVAGKMAKPVMLMRKYLGDCIFDRAIMSQVNTNNLIHMAEGAAI